MIISCSGITKNAKSKCTSTQAFVELDAFASYGMCTWEMADMCSKWLGEAEEECYKRRSANQQTVNFITADWVMERYYGGESVVNKAKFVNQKNIKACLGRDTHFPALQGCAYHSDWDDYYCWKYCPEYGWCWVNTYCREDSSLCKNSDLSCYLSCGY